MLAEAARARAVEAAEAAEAARARAVEAAEAAEAARARAVEAADDAEDELEEMRRKRRRSRSRSRGRPPPGGDRLLSFHQRPGEGQRDFKQRLRSFLRKE